MVRKGKSGIPECPARVAAELGVQRACKEAGIPSTSLLVVGKDDRVYSYNYTAPEENMAAKDQEYPDCPCEVCEKIQPQLQRWCADPTHPPDTPLLVYYEGSLCYCYCR